MKLKTRFALSFTGYTLVVLGLFGGTYYISEKQSAWKAQRAEEIKTLDKVVSVCREMSLTASGVTALNYFSVVKKDTSIVSVSCLSPKGLVQVHSDSREIGRIMQDPEDLKVLEASDVGDRTYNNKQGATVLELYAPVLVGGSKVGVAQVGYNRWVLESDIRVKLWTTLEKLMWVGGSTFLLALLLGLALAWSLSRPISRLVSAARAIGEGKLDYHVSADTSDDELGFLAGEMNTMAHKLKELDELKDDFISNVSHDLRSPMAAIKMYMEYMLNMDPDRDKILPKHKNILTTVMDSAMRLSVFVTNILDQAKIKAGRMEYFPQAVHLESLAYNIQALYNIVAVQNKVTLRTEIPPNLPSIYADPERFEQILSNLVSNALKFTPAGGQIRISARQDGPDIEVIVADTGKGIPAEELPKMFERFSQADVQEQRAKRIRGTGLGLAIVKETVEAMSGKISIRSEPGKGTEIVLRMPTAHIR